MDRPCAGHPFGATAPFTKKNDATWVLHRHGRRSRSRRMYVSVTLLLRGQAGPNLLRPATQACARHRLPLVRQWLR